MIIPRFVIIALLLAAGLLFSTQTASSSVGSGTSIVALFGGASDDTGSREWVELVGTHGLLCGRPKHKSIELIAVYAPGCDKGHLILRELEISEGKTFFSFSVPASLLKKTARATIHVKGHNKDLVLLEYAQGSWKKRRPLRFSVAADDGYEDLLVFSVEGLGLYCLQERDLPVSSASSVISNDSSASSLLGGDVYRGLLPLILSVVALVVCWSISRWIYRTEQYAGK
ncbi:MAG: hypothetical protein K8R75_01050 [Deltaproteobacteria bacterium]|nr:hypothetical protein [Deltaproteobacteria bacterium]